MNFRIRILPLVGICVALSGCRQVTPSQRGVKLVSVTPAGRYYALIVGINRYGQLPALETAVNDAEAVGKELHDAYGFETRPLLNADATRVNILNAVSWYRRNLRADDNLLIYYAGHGYNDKETGRAYWLPADASPDSNSNWISADDLTSDAKALPARHVLIVADSCYAGGLTRSGDIQIRPADQNAYLQKMLIGRSRNLMASGGNEPVSDAGKSGHSVFANAFLNGLDKMSDSFSAAELFDQFVLVPVAGGSAQVPQYNFLRDSGHEDGDFVFFPHGVGTAAPVAGPAPGGDPDRSRTLPPPTPAGAVKVNPKDGLNYVRIPAGRFAMGCSPDDTECSGDEKPAHEVTIGKDFWLGQTPVTQAAYRQVTRKGLVKGANLPVAMVTWDESRGYCGAIGGRLPTEAEWEYAARAGSAQKRYGDIDRIAWYSSNSGGQTHGVAQKEANAWGLYDMLGNVWQWTADWYGEYQVSAKQDPSGQPPGPGITLRALRGGSWSNDPRLVRASYRLRVAPGVPNSSVGLRCVWE